METSFLRKTQNAPRIWSFWFEKPAGLSWQPGDYVEVSLAQAGPQGDRRWASIASSPTEPELMFTYKVPVSPSVFKQTLLKLQPGDNAQLSPPMGSFNLPAETETKLLFVAAGVGIAPYRSMLRWLADTDDTRDIQLVYIAKPSEFIFGDILETAHIPITQTSDRIDFAWLKKRIPDLTERTIYLAGVQPLCESLYDQALAANIPRSQLKLSYFEGDNEL